MKTKLTRDWLGLAALLLATLIQPTTSFAQGSAFTYNGRLSDNGVPADGDYELRFTLYDASADGNVVAGPLPPIPAAVANGLFTLRLDFGADAFNGPARWLNIEVRPAGDPNFTALNPRHEVTSSPYAIRAASAGSVANGAVTANQFNTGVAPAPGQFLSYDGGSLVWSDPGVAAGNIWSLNGNRTFYNAGNVGIGTTMPETKLAVFTAGYGIEQTDGTRRLSTYLSESGGWFGTRTAHPLNFFVNSGQASLTVAADGNVGIGTSTPTPGIRLEVSGATLLKPGNGNIQFSAPNGELGQSLTPTAGNRADVRFDGSTLKLVAGPGTGPPSSLNGIAVHTSGNISIGSLEPPLAKVQIVAQDALSLVGYQPYLTLADSDSGYKRSRIQNVAGDMIFEPENYINGADGNAYAKLFNSGNLSVKSLTIRGGADLAEPFAMSQPEVIAGSVVVIDEANPGKLRPSTHAYDHKVAGIVSSANGIQPGISLYQEGTLEGGQNVALSGRVYVRADAASGAIAPGDLLTTSNTPGHAMKVSDYSRSQGAILGKAMSALAEGQGMVLVLVTLQ
jgi:hypothetical protein